MSKLLCNVSKISGGENALNAPPGCAPGSMTIIVSSIATTALLLSGMQIVPSFEMLREHTC